MAIGYLVGSIPFGYIITNFFSKENLHKVGSGSTGATNRHTSIPIRFF